MNGIERNSYDMGKKTDRIGSNKTLEVEKL